MSQEHQTLTKTLWHLQHQLFSCQADAEQAITALSAQTHDHTITWTLQTEQRYAKKGRPKVDDISQPIGYRIRRELHLDPTRIQPKEQALGRWVLATNELGEQLLPDEHILSEYKSLSQMESGFKLIKNKDFCVSSVFLKKPSRIEALMLVTTLCLMMYNLAQYQLRMSLQTNHDTIPNQLGQATDKPTLKWACRLLHKITVVRITDNDNHQAREMIANLCDVSRKIIRHLGTQAMAIYDLF